MQFIFQISANFYTTCLFRNISLNLNLHIFVKFVNSGKEHKYMNMNIFTKSKYFSMRSTFHILKNYFFFHFF